MTHMTSLAHNFEPRIYGAIGTGVASERTSHRAFAGVSALLFATSAALTVIWCGPMPAMGGMPMAGGWTMSMAWMRMPGQTWPTATASFAVMWTVMMVAMMLPSLAPALWRFRQTYSDWMTTLVGVGYFAVWTVLGMAVYPAGVALAAVEMRHQALAGAVPLAAGMAVLMAGVFQFTAWKAHHLACCRQAPPDAAAWRLGLRLGLHCICGCAGLTAILLVTGIMDWRAMAVITAAITAERVAPAGERVARAIGVIAAGTGLFLIARAAGLA